MSFVKSVGLFFFLSLWLSIVAYGQENTTKPFIVGKWQCIMISFVPANGITPALSKKEEKEFQSLNGVFKKMMFIFYKDSTYSSFASAKDTFAVKGSFETNEKGEMFLIPDKYKIVPAIDTIRKSKIIFLSKDVLQIEDTYMELILKLQRVK